MEIFFHQLILKLILINHQLPAMRLYSQPLSFINLILIILVISATPFSAQGNTIYKSTDAAGQVTYSDTPTPMQSRSTYLPHQHSHYTRSLLYSMVIRSYSKEISIFAYWELILPKLIQDIVKQKLVVSSQKNGYKKT